MNEPPRPKDFQLLYNLGPTGHVRYTLLAHVRADPRPPSVRVYTVGPVLKESNGRHNPTRNKRWTFRSPYFLLLSREGPNDTELEGGLPVRVSCQRLRVS